MAKVKKLVAVLVLLGVLLVAGSTGAVQCYTWCCGYDDHGRCTAWCTQCY